MPIFAEWSVAESQLVVQMSRALTAADPVTPTGFVLHDGGTAYRFTSALTVGDVVGLFGAYEDGVADEGSVCSYDGTSPEFVDELSLPVAAWDEYPWTPA